MMHGKTELPPTVLEPGRALTRYWTDLWRFRELFFFLAWRDFTVRYKQTLVGILWAVLRPLVTMLVLVFVFRNLAGLSSGDVPYAIMVFAGTLPWQLFSNALSDSSNSVVSNSALISKVYFPRLIVPGSAVVVGLVDFTITLVVLAGLMLWFQFAPTWHLLFLPFFVVVAFLAALGPGLLVTALNVRYRDFRFVLPFVIQFGLFLTPVGFNSALVMEKYGETGFLLYSLNPMVGVIDGFRWAICGTGTVYLPGFLLSMGVVFAFLWAGLAYFRATERTFADII